MFSSLSRRRPTSRHTRRPQSDFLHLARGSIPEGQSLLYVALNIEYIDKNEFAQLRAMTKKTAALISGLTSYLRRRFQP